MNALWKRACALFVFAPLLASGCSDPYAGRYAISGTVTLKGEPLKGGIVQFEPAEKQDTSSGAPIADGKYSIDRKKGLKAGKYRIRVTAGDGVTPGMFKGKAKEDGGHEEAAAPGGSRNIISKELVPYSWNVASEHFVTVEPGKTTFDFDIPAK